MQLNHGAGKNRIIDAVNALQGFSVGPGLNLNGNVISAAGGPLGRLPFIAAVIKDTGPTGSEDDYTDCRYWVQVQQNTGSYIDTAELTLEDAVSPDNSSGSNSYIFTAYNLSEYISGTHGFGVGTPVVLIPVFIDNQDDTNGGLYNPGYRWVVAGASSDSKGDEQFQNHTQLTDHQDGWGFVLSHSISTA